MITSMSRYEDEAPDTFNFGYNADQSPAMKGQLSSWQAVRSYIFAGNATITIRSIKTGTRFTYRIRQRKDKTADKIVHFVSLLRGPDNDSDYAYMGCIIHQQTFHVTSKSRVSLQATSMVAWRWMFERMLENTQMSEMLEVWHEGRCGRCNRKLTVPESVASGIGPECRKSF